MDPISVQREEGHALTGKRRERCPGEAVHGVAVVPLPRKVAHASAFATGAHSGRRWAGSRCADSKYAGREAEGRAKEEHEGPLEPYVCVYVE